MRTHMKTWYKLDEKCGTNTPRELIEILLQDYFTKRKSFAEAVLKQGWASRKQITVLYEMKRQHNQAYTYPWRDYDEWYGLGYEGHPGQYDGVC